MCLHHCSSFTRVRVGLMLVVGCLVLASTQARASEWYVSPNGGGGAGTQAQPWSLDYALSDTSNSRVKPGDTIWVMAGEYYAVAANDPRFQVNRQGTQSAPILVRNYQNGRATVHAYFDCGFNNNIGFITKWITFWGLEVQGRLTSNPLSTGKAFECGNSGYPAQNSPGIKIINCILHDCGSGGTGNWGSASDHETNGNLMYYNGYDGADRGHGHGLYVQSKGPQGHGQLHKDNVVFRNFDNGTQMYGSDAAFRDYVTYDGDVFFNNGEISHVSGLFCAMWLAGGQWSQGPKVLNVNSYTSSPSVGGYFWLDQSYNAEIRNGYFVTSSAHAFNIGNNIGLVMTNNTIVGYITGFSINQYGMGNVLIPGRSASGKRIIIRPNDYEPGRANIVIFNWDKSPMVSVDISTVGLPNGTAYEVRDVQNWYAGAVVAGNYNGSPITIPMTGLTVAAPIALSASYTTPPHTAPEFGTFVLLAQAATINHAPTVDAGPDQSIRLPVSAVTLAGAVTDDGLPQGAAVTHAWSQVSGPAAATIANASALNTSVTFPAAGTYVLRLTASDTALTSTDDVTVYVRLAGTNLDLHLPLDEGSGTVANDTSGSGHNATLTNSPVWTAGKIGGALQFNGTSNYASVKNFPVGSEVSVAFWFKPAAGSLDTANGYHYVFSWGTVGAPSNVNVWFTGATEAGIGLAIRTTAQDSTDTGTAAIDLHDPNEVHFYDGAWHHYCVTLSGASGRTIYIDGVSRANDHLGGGDTFAPSTDLFMGARCDLSAGRFFAGGIDEVRVYETALTDAEVRALYAGNAAPTANAGGDVKVMIPNALALAGSISDDGQPSGTCTSTWSMVSGPGTVGFANPNAAATTASFSTAGSYVLRLTASDTALSATDDVAVVVLGAGDFTGDGRVDGLDFLNWQSHYPNFVGGATPDSGDANGDGKVDGLDFLVWQAHYQP